MTKLASLWIGPELGNLEQLCARSFIDTGNELTIYCYDDLKDVPDGVKVADARSILDTKRILRHGGDGSPAIHADIFRYAMLQATGNIWVDLDVFSLREFFFDTEYVFGFEMGTQVNNAVLGLPKTSAALQGLCSMNVDTFGFPKAGNIKRRLEWLWSMRFRPTSIEYWPWGCTGPRAATYYFRKTGEVKHARPIEAFYPVGFQDLDQLVIPGALTVDEFSDATYGIHLWAAGLKRHVNGQLGGKVHPNSLLGELMSKYGLPLTV